MTSRVGCKNVFVKQNFSSVEASNGWRLDDNDGDDDGDEDESGEDDWQQSS